MRALPLCLALIVSLTLVACENPSDPTGPSVLIDVPTGPTEDLTPTEFVRPELPFDKAQLEDVGLQLYWSKPGVLLDGETVEAIYQLDENVYCVTNQNNLVAHDAISGIYRWRQNVGPRGQIVFAPTHADSVSIPDEPHGMVEILDPTTAEYVLPFDAVFVNTLSYVIVLDRKTGRLVRDTNAIPFRGYAASAAGVSDGANFYVPTAQGRVRSIDMNTATETWAESTGRTISCDLLYADNHLYAASEDGAIYCYNVTNGHEIWNHQMSGPVVTNFSLRKGRLVVPCKELRLYSFDALSGVAMWIDAFVLPSKLTTPVTVSELAAYQYCEVGGIFAVDLNTGQEMWNVPNGRKVLMVDDYKAYILDTDEQLHIISESSGEELAVIDFSGFDMVLTNATRPAIYAAMANGDLFCIRPESAGYLTPEMLKD